MYIGDTRRDAGRENMALGFEGHRDVSLDADEDVFGSAGSLPDVVAPQSLV